MSETLCKICPIQIYFTNVNIEFPGTFKLLRTGILDQGPEVVGHKACCLNYFTVILVSLAFDEETTVSLERKPAS